MPDLTTLITNGEATPVVNAAGASPIVDPFAKLLYDYNTAVKNDAKVPSIVTQDTGVNNQPIQLEDADSYLKYGVYLNDIDTQEQLNRRRAENQTGLEQFGNMVVQTVGDRIVLGTLRGFSDIVDSGISLFTGDRDFTNPVSKMFEDLQQGLRDRFEIYREDPNKAIDPTDLAWYLNGLTDVASTISLMIPALGISRGVGAAGTALRSVRGIGDLINKGINAGSKALRSVGVGGIAQKYLGEGAKLMANASLMRIGENYQEARESYKDIYDQTLRGLQIMPDDKLAELYRSHPEYVGKTNEEIADDIAGKGAVDTFWDDAWLVLLDAVQLKQLSGLFPGMLSRTATAGEVAANRAAIAGLAGREAAEVAESTVNKFIPSLQTLKTYGLELSEGFEEGWQYVKQQEALDEARNTLDKNYKPRTTSDFMKDAQMWNAAIWGAVGGIMFKGISDAVTNVANKYSKAGDVSSKARINEINGRISNVQAMMEDLENLNNGRIAVVDNNGQVVRDADGAIVYEDIDPTTAESKRNEIINNYLLSLVTNAANKGNYELFKTYISAPEIKEYLKNYNSYAEEQAAEEFYNDINSRVDNIYDTYLQEVKNATNAGISNPSTAEHLAMQNTRIAFGIANNNRKIQDYENEVSRLQQDLMTNKTNPSAIDVKVSEDIDNYKEKSLFNALGEYINAIEGKKREVEQNYNNDKIGKLQRDALISAYDKQVSKLIDNLNLTNENGEKVTKDNVQDFLSKNKLSDIAFNEFNNLYEQIAENVREINYLRLSNALEETEHLKNAKEYRDAAKTFESILEQSVRQSYNNAKKQLEDIYDEATNENEVDEITNYIASKNKSNLSKSKRNLIDEAYEGMTNFGFGDISVAAEIDSIARNARKQKSVRTVPATPQTPEQAAAASTPVGGTTTTPTSAAPTTPTPTPSPAATTPTTTPVVPPPTPTEPTAEEEAAARAAEAAKTDEDFYAEVDNGLRKTASKYAKEVIRGPEVSKDDFINTYKQRVVDENGYDLNDDKIKNKLNEQSEQLWQAYQMKRNGTRPTTLLNSAVNFDMLDIFDDDLTDDVIEQLIKEYVEPKRGTVVGKTVYVNNLGLITQILKLYKNEGKTFSPDFIMRLNNKIIDYINNKGKNYKILNPRNRSRELTSYNAVYNLVKFSEQNKIESDNRINLLSQSLIDSKGIDRQVLSYNLEKLQEGSEIYLRVTTRKGVIGGNVEFWIGAPSADGKYAGNNSTQIGYNTFVKPQNGDGNTYVFTSQGLEGYEPTLTKNADGTYTCEIDDIVRAVIYGTSDKYSDTEIEQFKRIVLGEEIESVADLKENKIIKDLFSLNKHRTFNNPTKENVEQVANYIRNIVYNYENLDENEADNADLLWLSYKNFIKRQWNNFRYTETLFESAKKFPDANTKIVVKSINKGKPIATTKAVPINETISTANENNLRIVKMEAGAMVAEDGSYRQIIPTAGDLTTSHVFNLLIPNGSPTSPEFVELHQKTFDNSSPYGVALMDELNTIFTNFAEGRISYQELYERLKGFFDVNGLITGVLVNDMNNTIIIRPASEDKSAPPIISIPKKVASIEENGVSEDNKKIVLHPNDDSKRTYVSAANKKNYAKALDELKNVLINEVLKNTRYSFPGDVINGPKLSTARQTGKYNYIYRTRSGLYKIMIGKWKNTNFKTMGNLISAIGIAEANLGVRTYENAQGTKVKSNFDYLARGSQRTNMKITGGPVIYERLSSDEKQEEQLRTQRKTLADDYKSRIDRNDVGDVTAERLVEEFAPNYYGRLKRELGILSLQDILPINLRFVAENTDNPNAAASYERNHKGTGITYVYKKYFEDSTNKLTDDMNQYNALRILLHENIHRKIDAAGGIEGLNSQISPIREALNRALNVEGSREYKEFDAAFGNEARDARERISKAITQIETDNKNEADINEEFIVESFTSNTLQKALNNITTEEDVKVQKPQTLLQKIFDYIRKIFNFGQIKDNTLLAKEFNIIADITKKDEITDSTPVEDDSTVEQAVDDNPDNENNSSDLDYNETEDENEDEDIFGGTAFSAVDIDTIEIPSLSSPSAELNPAESDEFSRLLGRGWLNMRCS